MPIHEGYDEPGHEHDNDALGQQGGVLDVIDQAWHPRQAEHEGQAWQDHVPTRVEGQDLAGGRQGVDTTLTLFQPSNGEQLYGSAVWQVLPADPDRLECRILPLDGPVMVTTSRETAEQAYAMGQGAATIVGGPFSWCPQGLERTRRNSDAVYIALPGPSAATTHVSVISSRRLNH